MQVTTAGGALRVATEPLVVDGPIRPLLRQRATERFEQLLLAYRRSERPAMVSFRELVGPIQVHDLTHSAYPYPARLLRQIPRFFLHCDQLTRPNDVVLDPFCGSGTVVVEAITAGRIAWGVDANPFARLLTAVKCAQLAEAECVANAQEVILRASECKRTDVPPVVNLQHWYAPATVSALGRLRRAMGEQWLGNESQQRFLTLCLALTAEQVSLRDPRIPVPVRRRDHLAFAATQSMRQVFETYLSIATRLAIHVASLPAWTTARAYLVGEDAQAVAETYEQHLSRKLARPSLVLTSPPYGAAQKYVRSTSLSLCWSGLATAAELADLERNQIGREHVSAANLKDLSAPDAATNKEVKRIARADRVRAAIYAEYYRRMFKAIRSLTDVLAPGGTLVLIAGSNTVGGRRVDTHKHVRDFALQAGLAQVAELRDPIRGRTLLTTRACTSEPLRFETVHILRKAE